ncbi:MAG: Flp pilus assembly complex ATPase component TadA [Sphingomonadaceae bacterium]|nr:Flp pilus assembly complex ATPase component TadA [Sphingomonadaceae bacterium]
MADVTAAPAAVLSAAPLPYGFARRHGVVVADGRALHRPGLALAARLEVQRRCGSIAFDEVDAATFEAALRDQHHDSARAAMSRADGDLAALAETAAADDLLDTRDDSPVVRLINALLLEAVRARASDVHFEAEETGCRVRFRVDGSLREVVRPAAALAPLIASRLKVMARLDIAEKRLPQDGRVALRIGGHEIDLRVSTLPARHGERIVLRLLDRAAADLDLATLGMGARDAAAFARMLARPHGMILVTGPTGSGKTTTLYAALRALNDGRRNILTVEDPVEYALAGIGQTQVAPKIGLTFARGLRAILRQDPDIIMVGEIRDAETAAMAVRSSLTGHFVLSTLHTASAVGSVARLVDMGVERYLLAPMLVGLVAQRLVRALCPDCRRPDVATAADAALTGGALALGTPLFRPGGCSACAEGYRGRVALYEVVAVDAALRALIHDGAAEADLAAAARAAGPGLADDGAAKIAAGVTSVAEVARVLGDDG